jgi:hypothetical protein
MKTSKKFIKGMKHRKTCESNENMEKLMRKCWAWFDDDKKKKVHTFKR